MPFNALHFAEATGTNGEIASLASSLAAGSLDRKISGQKPKKNKVKTTRSRNERTDNHTQSKRLHKWRSSTIREVLNVTVFLEEIEINKLRWFGHVMRMDENRKPTKNLERKPDGKRLAGRPRRRWSSLRWRWRREVRHCRRYKKAGCVR